LLVLDVANILYLATRGRQPGESDLLALVRALGSSRFGKQEVTLVCDGNPLRGGALRDAVVADLCASGRTRKVVFSGPHLQADDIVEQCLADSRKPQQMCVVSSDRRLRDAARRAGSASLRSEDFLEQLREDARRKVFSGSGDRSVAEISVRAWAAYFGIDVATGRATQVDATALDASKPTGDVIDWQTSALADLRSDHAELLANVDDAALDMERWLALHPPSNEVVVQKRARRARRDAST
jgi:hypothetical protein